MADLNSSIINSASKLLEKVASGGTLTDNEMSIIIMAINMDKQNKAKPIADSILKYGKKAIDLVNQAFPIEKGD